MRPVFFPSGIPDDPKDAIAWLHERIRDIETAAQEDNFDVADQFTVTNMPAAKVYTLDVATATVADLAKVVGTLILDMQQRGSTRGE